MTPVTMDEDVYWGCVVLAGHWSSGYLPRRYSLLRADPLPPIRKAVYVVTDHGGQVLYVGKTARGAMTRVSEHVRERPKARAWAAMWIVPLHDDTPSAALLAAEGTIGARLHPLHSRRLPRPRRWLAEASAPDGPARVGLAHAILGGEVSAYEPAAVTGRLVGQSAREPRDGVGGVAVERHPAAVVGWPRRVMETESTMI